MNNLNLLLVKHNQMESERLLLRPITLNDAEDMLNIHLMKKLHVLFMNNIKIWSKQKI
ncbi:hypothetical protein [Psychrobacillus sp. FSL K6-1464]|uniref:hypothetical protein n=1 Tax=Psychrobacillus sp. FSL K6-1464 TaxID=2921545 RepID=UPI0030F88FC1